MPDVKTCLVQESLRDESPSPESTNQPETGLPITRNGSLPRTHRKAKRKRGAQKGNKNAVKHGFYSSTLGVSETCELWNIVNLEGLDIEIAVLRLKLKSVLQQDPGNRRVLLQASKLLTKWYCAKYGLDRAGSNFLKATLRDALEHYREQPPQDHAQ